VNPERERTVTEHSAWWSIRLQEQLDAPGPAADLETHLRGCAPCRTELASLRRVDDLLAQQLGGFALDERFDRRVLERAQVPDPAQIAARRALVERQHQRWSEALARNWRSTRHVLGARVAALAVTIGVVLAIVSSALSTSRFADAYRELVLADPQFVNVLTLFGIGAVIVLAWTFQRSRAP